MEIHETHVLAQKLQECHIDQPTRGSESNLQDQVQPPPCSENRIPPDNNPPLSSAADVSPDAHPAAVDTGKAVQSTVSDRVDDDELDPSNDNDGASNVAVAPSSTEITHKTETCEDGREARGELDSKDRDAALQVCGTLLWCWHK